METIARSQYAVRPTLASDLSFEGDKGVTKQSDLKDCDINLIMKRFEKTGTLPNLIAKNGHYGDFSNVPDYQEAVQIVAHANEQFLNLDAHVRNRFDNDPAKFLAFATDPKNEDEMYKMGLMNEEAKNLRKSKLQASIAAQAEADRLKKEADEQALIARIKAELNKPA